MPSNAPSLAGDQPLPNRLAAFLSPKVNKVLIAEDDPVSAKVLAAMLERLHYHPILARNGAEAWEIFDREPVRLIVSDWMMPKLDGLDFCRRVRERSKTLYTYFVLLTANQTSAENYTLAATAGVDDFLTKPLDRELMRMRLGVAERILGFTAEIRQLKELIPICVYCHKVRDQDNYWHLVEAYIQKETGSRFSHGACPDCCQKEIDRFNETSHAA